MTDFNKEIIQSNASFLESISNKSPLASIVANRLPELTKKTNIFNRSNSLTTLNMMTLTMLNGQSPIRQIRQILAEIEQRQLALSESQVTHAEILEQIRELEHKLDNSVAAAKYRNAKLRLAHLENKINGAIKDIAALIKTYDSITKVHGLENWNEETFEKAESTHHVRRGFELLYRNIVENNRASDSTIEYLQQFGVHIQVALYEILGYIAVVEEEIRAGNRPTASHLEDFLDSVAVKYQQHPNIAANRMFGYNSTFSYDTVTDRDCND